MLATALADAFLQNDDLAEVRCPCTERLPSQTLVDYLIHKATCCRRHSARWQRMHSAYRSTTWRLLFLVQARLGEGLYRIISHSWHWHGCAACGSR